MRRLVFRLLNAGLVAGLLALSIQGCATIQTTLGAEREFNRGVELFRTGKYAEAHAHALAAWSEAPRTTKYMTLLGWTYLKQGNAPEAERLFSAAYRQENDSLGALQGMAWVEYTKGRTTEARQWFERQLKRGKELTARSDWEYFDPKDSGFVLSCISDAEYGLGLIALADRRYPEALHHFSSALTYRNDFTGHGPIKAAMGDVFYFQGDYSGALGHYRDALTEKEDPYTKAKLAWCLYFTGEGGKAEAIFREGFQTSADTRPFLYGLAFTAHARKMTTESKTRLEELIRLDPAYADVPDIHRFIEENKDWRTLYRDFAQAYLERGEFEKAREKLSRYLRSAKNDCEALIMEAWCNVYLGRLPAGLDQFTTLSRKKGCPTAQALLGKGVALLYLGRLSEADSAFNEVISKDPGNTRAKVARGAVAFLRGDLEKAIGIYTKYLDQLPPKELYFSWPSHALNNLGWSYIRTGKYQEALDTFKRLQAYHPIAIYHEVLDGLGWSYFYLGRSVEAKEAFQQSLRIAPENPSALAGLSKISAAGPGK